MSGALSPGARQLVEGATSVAQVAERLAAGHHGFGRFLIPGLVPEHGLTVAYGATGTAKSFFMIHVGLAVAAGLPWGDGEIERGTVVFLASEDRLGVEARAVAAAQRLGLAIDDLPFEIVTAPAIHNPSWVGDLLEVLQVFKVKHRLPVKLVILDTLGGAFGDRDQDNAGAMSGATQNLLEISRLGRCAVLATHHTGKDADRGHRGSQVLKDRSDAFIRLKRSTGGRFTASIEKARNAAMGSDVSFRLAPCDLHIGDRVVTAMRLVDLTTGAGGAPADTEVPEQGASSQPRKLPEDARTCLEALKSIEQNGTSITFEVWRSACKRQLGDRKARNEPALRKAFNEGKNRLAADGLIVIADDTVRIAA